MNIQDLKSNTTWQEASNTINNNNNKISLAIATLENAKLKNKGYFTTKEKLNEAIPNPTIGSKAYVGTSEPYAIYIVENGVWIDSGYTGGDEIVAKITTDRIENGAVTSEKISSTAFDSTLSVSGKIAPADVVGGKLTELDGKIDEIRQEDANNDFSIADDSGYDIVQFNGGNIKTKNFDSKVVIDGLEEHANEIAKLNESVEKNTSDIENVPKIQPASFDLSFQDESGYDIVRFYDGHIETKNFSSKYDALKDDANDFFSVKDENGNPLMLINGGILVYPNGRIRTMSFDSAKTQYSVPKKNNQRCDIHKKSFRVLDIGNSHSWDCIRYLKDIVKESSIDVSDMAFVSLRRGGSSWKSWYNGWHDQDTESGDVLTGSTYYISKEFGGLDVVVKGNNLPEVTPITFQGNNAEEYRSLMRDNKFDLIVIHQNYLGLEHYDEWNGHGEFGYLPEFMMILHTTQPQAEIGTLINHAPFSQSGFSLFGTKEWLNNVVYQTDRKFIEEYGIRFIVPYGTALENIRQSHYNTSTHGLNYDLNAPIHSGLGLAVYTNSCTYFESLIAPRYGISVLGNSFRVILTDEQKPGYKDASISVDNDDIAYTAQMAAILAVNNMWEVQNPDNINI